MSFGCELPCVSTDLRVIINSLNPTTQAAVQNLKKIQSFLEMFITYG